MRAAVRAVCAILVAALGAAAAGDSPEAYLAAGLGDPNTAPPILAALRATGETELTPLFAALLRSGDKRLRLFAAGTLRELGGAEATGPLRECLRTDPAMVVRSEALLSLLRLKTIGEEDLQEAARMEDESIQCVAARSLARRGSAAASATLTRLTGSKDPATAGLARMSLLAAGRHEQLSELERLLADPATAEDVVGLLMEQVAEEKIAPAAGLAERAAAKHPSAAVRVAAYRAVSAVSPDAGRKLAEALRGAEDLAFGVRVLRILAQRDDAAEHLKRLTDRGEEMGLVVRFELARPGGGAAAEQAARRAIAAGHPIIVDYLLDRARQDIDGRGGAADFYTPMLLDYVRSVRPNVPVMQLEHFRAARAGTLLADLATLRSLEGLQELLEGPYSATTRAAAAGLLKTRNRLARDLAKPLLGSPYQELAVDAALTLGRFGDPAAKGALAEIVAHPARSRTELTALAAWYLLKVEGRSASAARQLAAKVR